MGELFGDDGGDGRFDSILFTVVPLFIAVIAVLVLSVLVFTIGRGLVRWNRNNNSPLLTVPASVVTRRTERGARQADTPASTYYYVTFEIQGGERIEFPVRGKVFGLLAERDRGRLSYQGTRFKGFDRTPQDR